MNLIFVSLAAGVLFIMALMYLLVEQRGISASSSQELTRLPALKLQGYMDTSFQDKLEQALKDQFFLHDDVMQVTLSIKAALRGAFNAAQNLLRGSDAGLVPFGNVFRMYGSDHLTNIPYAYDDEMARNYRRKAGEINEFALRYPETKLFVYYCSRAEDMNWFDDTEGISSFSYSAYLQSLLRDDIRFDYIKFRDFSDFAARMYKTDHHWNDVGAAQGYADILRLLSRDFEMGGVRSILGSESFDNLLWQGSRARESGVSIPANALDKFVVSRYDLPDHSTWFGGREQEIGLAEDYASGFVNREIEFDQYLNYFGFESEVIRLEFPENRGGLLIVGDSFARAIRGPVASHFHTTVYVNFRLLDHVSLDDLMREYDFDAVLFIGQQDAWSGYFMETGDGKDA